MAGRKIRDLTGQKFGRLTTVSYYRVKNSRNIEIVWRCKCACGKHSDVKSRGLISGRTKSCGCLRREKMAKKQTTHGYSCHPSYKVWTGMRTRCSAIKGDHYKNYVLRGIKVCSEWINSPKEFCIWAENNGYKDGLEIDRIDNNGGYSPDNCRFVSSRTNCNNRRNSKTMKYKGKEVSMSYVAEENNIGYDTLAYRVKAWWSIEKCLAPVGGGLHG